MRYWLLNLKPLKDSYVRSEATGRGIISNVDCNRSLSDQVHVDPVNYALNSK